MTAIDALKKSPLLILIACSLTLNVALAARVQTQRDVIRGLTPAPALPVGQVVGALTGTTLQGSSVRLVPAEHRGLALYVYTAACGWCIKNAANMKETLSAARAQGMGVYAVALDDEGAQAFLDTHGIIADIVVPSEDSVETFSLGGTPQLLIIGPDGRIVKNWRGAFLKSTAADVESYFRITLPGLPASGAN